MVWIGVLAGGGLAGYRLWSQRQAQTMPTPQWPPLSPEPRATAAAPKPTAAKPAAATSAASQSAASQSAAAPAARWVAPVNGECPEGYPVKANDNSKIFHVPGGRFYARTVAERCYVDAHDAVADGYRPAKA